jgi:hypothetical protein
VVKGKPSWNTGTTGRTANQGITIFNNIALSAEKGFKLHLGI